MTDKFDQVLRSFLGSTVAKRRSAIDSLEKQIIVLQNALTHPDQSTNTYRVTTTSMWSNEGEVGATSESKDLKRAISHTGAKHQRLNGRKDWQVYWSVVLRIHHDGEYLEIPLPADMYVDLLPGGTPAEYQATRGHV